MFRIVSGLAIVIIMAIAGPATAARSQDEMTREKYTTYLNRFNAGDDRYAELYAEDVIFDHGPFFGILKSRQAIVDFYRDIRTKLKETITVSAIVIDNEHGVMAAELSTRLLATRDGVQMPSALLNKGDSYVTQGTVYYGLKNGRITTIRGGISGAKMIPASTSQK